MSELLSTLTKDMDTLLTEDGRGLSWLETKWRVHTARHCGGRIFHKSIPKLRKDGLMLPRFADWLEAKMGEKVMFFGAEFSMLFNSKVLVTTWNHGQSTQGHMFCTPDVFDMVSEYFAAQVNNEPRISFLYSSGRGGTEERDVYLDEVDTAHDVHYPYINGGVDKFLDSYWENKAPILFLQGPPGTGKTSLIRYFLKSRKLMAKCTFDEAVMKSDSFYLEFLMNKEHQVLIIEDADTIILSRESFGNKKKSKLLNFAEGIAKFQQKKIVFSTNLDNFEKIDPALLRPGRCFEAVECRKLTMAEANDVCGFHNLQKVEKNREYSIAEIFNQKENPTQKYKIGF